MHRFAFVAATLSVLVFSTYASALPSLESRAGNRQAVHSMFYCTQLIIGTRVLSFSHSHVDTQMKRHFSKRAILSTLPPAVNTTSNEIEASFNPSALPNPWPLGLLSIILSLAGGLSNYKTTPPDYKSRMQLGWGITLVRALGLGISSIIKMRKGNYSGVSSDGFLALFSNVVGLMAANRDYGKFWWATGGVVGMFFGLCPALIRLSLALWTPNGQYTYSPFRLSDGNRCIINRSSYCNTDYPQYNVPYCHVPVLEKGGQDNILTLVDYVRLVAWLLALLLCTKGVVRLFKKEEGKVFNRGVQVFIAYLALIFDIALVLSSAVIYAKGQRSQALDCRAATSCTQSQPLPCPSITVFSPRSVNGFFGIWFKQLSGWNIPAILV